MVCMLCKKEVCEEDSYTLEGQILCERCAWKKGIFPLGHTGARRDKISERGRVLTLPKP